MKKRLLHIMALVMVTTLFVGCAPVYRLPPNTPSAKLGVSHEHMFGNETMVMILKDPYHCRGLQVMPFNNRLSGKPIPIKAGVLTTLVAEHIVGYSKMWFAASFVPKAHHIYLVRTFSKKHYPNVGVYFTLLESRGRGADGKYHYRKISFIKRNYNINQKRCLAANISALPRVKSLKQSVNKGGDLIDSIHYAIQN